MSIQSRSFFAMGSHMTVWLESESDMDIVGDEVVAQFATAEARFSRFLPDSELSQLNARPNEWVTVSAEMLHLLQLALQLAAQTHGYFDPTILSALEAAGYARSFEQLNPLWIPPTPAPAIIDYRAIQLDLGRGAVWLPEGMGIDLGGIAKGYTAQKVVDWLRSWGPCLLDAGGDLVAGDAPANDPGWPVGIAAPWTGADEQENLLRLWLANAALTTSGIDYRRWQRGDQQKHHIIDPVTGDSAETDLITVTILAEDASTAEAWATAALVAGQSRAIQLLTQHALKAALIQSDHTLTLTPTLRPLVQWEPAADTQMLNQV